MYRNYCGGIVGFYWSNILDCASDKSLEVRQAVLKIIEVVLRQGLVHPITSVPTLVALEMDQHVPNAKLAGRLVSMMHERHPGFLETKFGDGLQLSFQFIRSGAFSSASALPGKGVASLDSSLSKFSDASTEGIANVYKLLKFDKKSRRGFLSSIVRKFDLSSRQEHDVDLRFLEYCTEIMSTLPFGVPDEPLYLIYSINRLVQLRAGTLQSVLRGALTGASPLAAPAAAAAGEITAERAARGEAPLDILEIEDVDAAHARDATVMENGDIGKEPQDMPNELSSALEKAKGDAKQAMAMALLLLLKRYMKLRYNLSDARCQAFQPSEAIQKGDMLSRRDTGSFSSKELPLVASEDAVNNPVRQLLLQYQAFKTLLIEDTTSDFMGFPSSSARQQKKNLEHHLNGSGAFADEDAVFVEPVNALPDKSSLAATRARRRRSEPVVLLDDNDDEEEEEEEDPKDNYSQERDSVAGSAGGRSVVTRGRRPRSVRRGKGRG
eukprot:TRINITY_DN2329_c0_g1_i10.p1 TRINITY_DN2329_c0_g1~~TRINITY_DN2329_c0_g1_i10.p1  ORF type:complete len:495 (-),score=86.59 TRINITY_DN2329_c0_g1_i10:1202-2686(-)